MGNLQNEYQDAFSHEIRKKKGEFYTPDEIVKLILMLTIRKETDLLLDPSCGAGNFLAGAHHYLKTTHNIQYPNEQIYGIELKKLPFYISCSRLLELEGEKENILKGMPSNLSEIHDNIKKNIDHFRKKGKLNIIQIDFFNVKDGSFDKPFDVIIGNPPYVRQRNIKNKKSYRKHLDTLMIGDKKAAKIISARSDLYTYFFTYSLQFLKEGGRLGFITPNKWMITSYGKGLQKFFLSHFRIKYIINFSRNLFSNVLVPTSIIILEKFSNKEERKKVYTHFITINDNNQLKFLFKLIKNQEIDIKKAVNLLKTYSILQSTLYEEERWDKYLLAPEIYWELKKISQKNHKFWGRFSEIGEINYRIKTGYDKFFYISVKDAIDWDINSQFLTPVAISPQDIHSIQIDVEETKYYVLDLNEYISQKLDDLTNIPDYEDINQPELSKEEIYIINELRKDNFMGLYNYIFKSMEKVPNSKFGPPQTRPTCISHQKSNKCWFNLGQLYKPDILVPETLDKRLFSAWNNRNFVADVDLIDVTLPDTPIYYKKLLCAYLNSSIFHLFREVEGRISGGGAIRLKIFELKGIHVINLEYFINLSKMEKNVQETIDRIVQLFDKIKVEKITSDEFNNLQNLIDIEFFQLLNIDLEFLSPLKDGLNILVKSRKTKSKIS